MVSCGLAMTMSGAACSRDQAAEVDRDTGRLAADTAKQPGHEGAPITVTGCLQRGSGLNDFLLTQVNSPPDTPVATSGKDSSGAAVQREQLRQAKHAYTLDGDKDALRELIGKQVRVTGSIIDTVDLAKIAVQGIVQVADACDV
jgi:hypothetical protein